VLTQAVSRAVGSWDRFAFRTMAWGFPIFRQSHRNMYVNTILTMYVYDILHIHTHTDI
jgi:hypothetical protein